jgi:formiminotetrahydrofolate cyclodeaminase
MQRGLAQAVSVPLETMRIADGAWESMLEIARHGNLAARSDLEVGARALETGIWGAYRNVLVNLGDIEDAAFVRKVTEEADALRSRAERQRDAVLSAIAER